MHHYLLLHLQFQSTQIGKQEVRGGHDRPYFEHQRAEVFVVLSHGTLLPQVEQTRLMLQIMMQILEFHLDVIAPLLPAAPP